MPKFKNVGADVHAVKRADLGGELVVSGAYFEVGGEVSDETDDAYIVGSGDDARAWPKAQWELVKTAAKTASAKEA